MSARQREPAGDGDTRVRFFLGAIAPPQAAEGAQFCKLPPETRACRKAAARGVQGNNQRRLRCAVKVKLIKLEGGTAAGMIGRWKQKRKAPARGRFTANAAYPFIRTNALRAYPQGVCCCLGWDDANRPAFTPARWSAGSAAGPPVRAWRSAHW